MKKATTHLIPQEVIENKILLIRSKKVMLDRDLASLYEVETKQLTRQVRRNITRFPKDFMFRLTKEEYKTLRCQIGTLKRGRHSKYLPYVFTEQGVAMLSSILNSERAIQVNIAIMRVFVRLKEIISTHKKLAHKLMELERKMEKKDEEIKVIFEVIRELMAPSIEKPKRRIGFHREQ
ncbi:ORF6N domain-containing protein [Candidatus Omnitrophota bacterium]